METFRRALVALVIGIAFFAGIGLIERPIAHAAPSMTPQAEPVTRVAPTPEQIARATPSPRPGF